MSPVFRVDRFLETVTRVFFGCNTVINYSGPNNHCGLHSIPVCTGSGMCR